ncbi:MAG TPA: hypothetical protein VHO67_13930 [Polyangia bacterium]|nr:hypothetical protein [Polyangia bacterium]
MIQRAPADVIPLASRRRTRPEPLPASTEEAGRPRRSVFAVALGLVALTGAFIAGRQHSRLQQVRSLDPEARASIFARALDDLKTSCAAVDPADEVLREHCRDQATFLVMFPECDAACESLAAAALPHAHR